MHNIDSSSSNELVSIVMPAYNAERYLATAVESVLCQTYPGWELLIVDDASTDKTREIAEQFQRMDQRVKVLGQHTNSGVAQARNTALAHAKGKYIAFLDSDDFWVPDKLEQQIAFMQVSNVSISYGGYRRIDENGHPLGSIWPPEQLDYATLLKSNFIGNLTGMYNADVLGKQYFGKLQHEDYVAWLALLKQAGIARSVSRELGSYRVHKGSTSSNKLQVATWQWQIYRQAEHLSVMRSCSLMLHYFYYAIRKRL